MFGATAFDKKWSGYGLAFGIRDFVHIESGKNAKNLIIVGVDTSDGDKTTETNILVLSKGSVSITRTETIEAKKEIKTNCTITNEKCFLSLHYNGDNSYLFVYGIQQYKFKAKGTEIKLRKLCLGGFSVETFLISYALGNGKIYHFSVDYQLATIDKIQKNHKYLMKKHNK